MEQHNAQRCKCLGKGTDSQPCADVVFDSRGFVAVAQTFSKYIDAISLNKKRCLQILVIQDIVEQHWLSLNQSRNRCIR